ncbi:ABC transporter ATP-binding protein [uncultured Lactobacillus sp.]|uniref:ATP-binding cassette domain-containing protein n=1 Tax=uncultured Lactobacillus sp. TaxID=153152 RepID=UPI00262271ED|nr:ABC transporter ATP-binding protein [uncultured Lactobacillus sp.]
MLFKYSNKMKFVVMIICGLIASFQNIIMAAVVQQLTNMATKKQWDKISIFLLVVTTAFITTLIASLLFNSLKTQAIAEVNMYLRTNIFAGMLENSKEDNSDSLSFLTTDFKLLETNRFDAQIQIIMQAFSLVLALGYALLVNWLITLMFLVASMVPMFVSNLFQKPVQNAAEKWTQENGNYVNQTKNFLAGADTLRLYGGNQSAVSKNAQTVGNLEKALRKMNLLNLNASSWINFLAALLTFVVPFAMGIYLVIQGQTTLGGLFAIVQLANSFVNPVLNILDDRNKLATTKKIMEKVQIFLANKKKDKAKKIDVHDLKVKDLDLFRKDDRLANGINFKLEKGKKMAVIGPSGAGKSTLLQFLMYGGFGKAREILLNGQVEQAGDFSEAFAYASQAPIIFADSLWFNLTLGEDISKSEVMRVCEKLGLDAIVKEKGFDYSLGVNADQLSGGQLARIELARAILAKRSILLLDEINASLDKTTADEIHDFLRKSDLTFIEVIHHYEPDELKTYDQVLDLKDYI